MSRFMWWSPRRLSNPWLPSVFRGGDEWHNPSIGVVVPLLGAFIVFYGRQFSRDGETHVGGFSTTRGFDGRVVPGCADCAEFVDLVAEFTGGVS